MASKNEQGICGGKKYVEFRFFLISRQASTLCGLQGSIY